MATSSNDIGSREVDESDRGERVRRAFQRADSDLSGKIQSDQFATAVQAAGFEPSVQDVDRVLQHFDKDEDSGINFDEFIDMISHLEAGKEEDYEDCLRKAFKEFDRDGSGYISPEELRDVVCNTGEKFTQDEAEELIAMFDVNKDGQLSWEEFVTFIKSSITEEEEEFEKQTMDKSQQIEKKNGNDDENDVNIENNRV